MALSKREKLIATTLGVVLAGVAANSLLIRPYFDERSGLSDSIVTISSKNDKADEVLFNRKRVNGNWKTMLSGGLKTSASEAEIAAVRACYDWSQNARVTMESVKSDQAEQVGDFQQVRITATVLGNMGGLAHWLYNLETSALPIQLGDVRINARKEGTDDLNMQVTMNALAFVPLPPKTSSKTGQPGGK